LWGIPSYLLDKQEKNVQSRFTVLLFRGEKLAIMSNLPNSLVVSREPLLRRAMQSFFHEVMCSHCQACSCLAEVHDSVNSNPPAIVVVAASVLDEELPRIARDLKAIWNVGPIITISGKAHGDLVRRLIGVGVKGVLTSLDSELELRCAVETVLQGSMFVSREASNGLKNAVMGRVASSTEALEAGLSLREMEIYELIGLGKTGKAIASALHLSPKTVETYKQRLKEKLHLKNAAELLRAATTYALHHP
jgi:DNA-binding NarL/FixJ family response regulator